MGTRSTTKFYQKSGEKKTMKLAVYQQYDGYPSGVGEQIYEFLNDIKMVNGFRYNDKLFETANGIGDLALQFVLKYKNEVGGMYATDEDDYQEWNYNIIHDWDTDEIIIEVDDGDLFRGNLDQFKDFIKRSENE